MVMWLKDKKPESLEVLGKLADDEEKWSIEPSRAGIRRYTNFRAP